jgi:hypothetical protein
MQKNKDNIDSSRLRLTDGPKPSCNNTLSFDISEFGKQGRPRVVTVDVNLGKMPVFLCNLNWNQRDKIASYMKLWERQYEDSSRIGHHWKDRGYFRNTKIQKIDDANVQLTFSRLKISS